MNKFKFGGMVLIAAVFLVVFATIVIAGQIGSGGDTQNDDEPVVGTVQAGKTGHAKEVAQDVKIVLNGEELIFNEPPLVIDGRVMVPACELAERLGAFVQWDEEMTEFTIINLVDVLLDERFYRHILVSILLGLIEIPSDGRIEPDSYVTIAEFIIMLGRLHETWNKSIGLGEDGTCYVRYLEWAVDIGVIQVDEFVAFGTTTFITYEQMAVFAYRYLRVFELRFIPPDYARIRPPLHRMTAEELERTGVSTWANNAVLYFFRTVLYGIPIDAPINFIPQNNVSRVNAIILLLHVNSRYNLTAQS